MVSSTLIQIFTTGPIEKVLYGNPQITFFKSVYKRPTNFASQYVTKTPFSPADWGKIINIDVPREADLLGGVYIRIKLSDLVRKHVYLYSGIGIDGNTIGWEMPNPVTVTDTSESKEILANTAVQTYIQNELDLIVNNSSQPLNPEHYTFEPQFSSLVNGIGALIIDYVSISAGNKELERFTGEWIWLNNEISNQGNSKAMFNKSIYFEDSFTTGVTNTKDLDLMISIPFFFTKDSGSYLPLMAMNNEKIEITVKLKELHECIIYARQMKTNIYNSPGLYGRFTYNAIIGETATASKYIQSLGSIPTGEQYKEEVDCTIESFEIIYNYYHLSPEEQTYFLTKKHNYVVPIIKTLPNTRLDYVNINKTHEIPLELRNPVKFIIFILQRNDNYENHDYMNCTYEDAIDLSGGGAIILPDTNRHIVDRFNLSIDSIDILDKIPAKILNNMELLTKFKNNSKSLFYVYSFSMFPNDIQPSGTLNFTHFSKQFIKLNLVDATKFNNQKLLFRGYYSSYNILTIEDGLAGFRYI